jgi:hypothetical protein
MRPLGASTVRHVRRCALLAPKLCWLLRSAERSAWHLELRDGYVVDDPDWLNWQAGRRFDPADQWADWQGANAGRDVCLAAGPGVRLYRHSTVASENPCPVSTPYRMLLAVFGAARHEPWVVCQEITRRVWRLFRT